MFSEGLAQNELDKPMYFRSPRKPYCIGSYGSDAGSSTASAKDASSSSERSTCILTSLVVLCEYTLLDKVLYESYDMPFLGATATFDECGQSEDELPLDKVLVEISLSVSSGSVPGFSVRNLAFTATTFRIQLTSFFFDFCWFLSRLVLLAESMLLVEIMLLLDDTSSAGSSLTSENVPPLEEALGEIS